MGIATIPSSTTEETAEFCEECFGIPSVWAIVNSGTGQKVTPEVFDANGFGTCSVTNAQQPPYAANCDNATPVVTFVSFQPTNPGSNVPVTAPTSLAVVPFNPPSPPAL